MEGLFFVLIAVAIIGAIVMSFVMAARRRKALQQWADSQGLSYREGKDYDMEDRLAAFDCLRKGHRRYAYNRTEGQLAGYPYHGFDYHYETYSRDSKGHRRTHHHRFSAVVLESAVPLKELLIRPENFFDKLTEFVGWDDIDFESAEFSRKFYVKARDRRWAYDMLHARAMEWLMEHPQFTMEMQGRRIMAWKGSTFEIGEFSAAAETAGGLLDLMPDYLVRQQNGNGTEAEAWTRA